MLPVNANFITSVRPPDDLLQRQRLHAVPRPATAAPEVRHSPDVSGEDVLWETDLDLRLISRRNEDHSELLEPWRSGSRRSGTTILEWLRMDAPGPGATNRLEIAALWEDLLARRSFRGFIHRALKPDGDVVWLETHGDPFFSADGIFLGYRGITRDITAQREDSRAAFLADHDALTGLFNRTAFQARLARSLAEPRPGMCLAVLLIDLDNFTLINDSMGHPVGDELLRSIGERLALCIRHCDAVARVDGDEFAIMQVDLAQPEEAAVLAERVLQTIRQPCEIHGHRLIATATIGIAVALPNGADAVNLMKNADIAQYRAKAENTGGWRFYEPAMGARVRERRTIEAELRDALARGEFEIYYQPFYNVVAQHTCAFEALVRWRHPQRGLVLPDQFIGVAEETGLIVPLGAWILQAACMEAAKWPPHVSVAINLSPAQFRGRSPVEDVRNALRASALSPSRLELEITESVLLHDCEESLRALHELRGMGCRISMDDFGIGYSSLSYLHRFPFDKIKIDRSFIQGLNDRKRSIEIVRAIAALGNSLQLATTAEGVETQEQFSIVCSEGCTEVQGYLFSEPRPARYVNEMMADIPEEMRFGLPDSVPSPESAPQSVFVNEPPNGDIFCGEAI